jgi:hypothetical protein
MEVCKNYTRLLKSHPLMPIHEHTIHIVFTKQDVNYTHDLCELIEQLTLEPTHRVSHFHLENALLEHTVVKALKDMFLMNAHVYTVTLKEITFSPEFETYGYNLFKCMRYVRKLTAFDVGTVMESHRILKAIRMADVQRIEELAIGNKIYVPVGGEVYYKKLEREVCGFVAANFEWLSVFRFPTPHLFRKTGKNIIDAFAKNTHLVERDFARFHRIDIDRLNLPAHSNSICTPKTQVLHLARSERSDCVIFPQPTVELHTLSVCNYQLCQLHVLSEFLRLQSHISFLEFNMENASEIQDYTVPVDALSEFYKAVVSRRDTLTTLNVNFNAEYIDLEAFATQCVSRCTQLKTLCVALDGEPGDKMLRRMMKILSEHASIVCVNFYFYEHNNDTDCMRMFAKYLKRAQCIEKFVSSVSNVFATGLFSLGDVISVHPSLRTLCLGAEDSLAILKRLIIPFIERPQCRITHFDFTRYTTPEVNPVILMRRENELKKTRTLVQTILERSALLSAAFYLQSTSTKRQRIE